MDTDQALAQAIASNNTVAAAKALEQGARLPRPSMKHPVFTWLCALGPQKAPALPMLELLVENGLDPAFRVKAMADRLPRSDFTATLSSRVTRQNGDKGDSLLGRLIRISQFPAAQWLAGRVPPETLLSVAPKAADTLMSPLERAMLAGEWGLVSAMLDRLDGYDIGKDADGNWARIHKRAVKHQLSPKAPTQQAQCQIDRIFKMSQSADTRLPPLPANLYPYSVPQSSLDAWARGVPGAIEFLFEDGQRTQVDGWSMLFASPESYHQPAGMLRRVLADPRFGQVASRQYSLEVLRNKPDPQRGTLCEVAMSGEVEFACADDRAIVVDLLRSHGCAPSHAPDAAFKHLMAKGFCLQSRMPESAWKKYPGQLPEDALAYCRRGTQFQELISWGVDPCALSQAGTPALVELMRSMRKRASSNNLRDLSSSIATLLEQRPSLLSLACPKTGETVADLAFQRISMSNKVAQIAPHYEVNAWTMVSACLGGLRLDERLKQWVSQHKSDQVLMPGTDESPWFYCVMQETLVPHTRTAAQQNEVSCAFKALSQLGRWPQGSAMEGFKRLVQAREPGAYRAALQKSSFARHFLPGEIACSITSIRDVDLLVRTAVEEGRAMLNLVHDEIAHMDTPTRIDLFCSWVSQAREFINNQPSDRSYEVDTNSTIPHESVMALLELFVGDASIGPDDLRRIISSTHQMIELERSAQNDHPDAAFARRLDQLQLHISHLGMHAQTSGVARSTSPRQRF